MSRLEDVFARTGGPDESAVSLNENVEPTPSFLKPFEAKGQQFPTGFGTSPIMNPFAVVMPTRSDRFYDASSFHDHRLGNGLGVSRPFRKPDSLLGTHANGLNGPPMPTKNFGRSTRSHDQMWNRVKNQERANNMLAQMGSKAGEAPQGSLLRPWQWNDVQALGTGQPGHQYNRHYGVPDASATHRRLYEPTPSKRTKMIPTDMEIAALRPSRTAMHPLKVLSEDQQRAAYLRIGRNTDVAEAVTYENIHPRGMGPPNGQNAVPVYADPGQLRQPVGNGETGDRSLLGRWGMPGDTTKGGAMHAATNEDAAILFRDHTRYVLGHDVDEEVRQFHAGNAYLNSQTAADPAGVTPTMAPYGVARG